MEIKVQVIKGVIENPKDDRTGEVIATFMSGRFVDVRQLERKGIKVIL